MNLIVLDMEWNQPWPGSPSSKKTLPVQLHGEIIQIGAVRLTEDQRPADEFQAMVRLKYYRRLNSRVSKLTGIKASRLEREGLPFPEVITRFRAWCGENVVLLTWGFDDVGILRENLQLYGLDHAWMEKWYNLQMIFNAQTDGSSAQKALKTAMETFGIEPSRPAHDALGDAYHTALICQKLDLQRGIAEYGHALSEHVNGFHGAEVPGCISRKVFYDFPDRSAAFAAMSGEENRCPVCGKQMTGSRWFAQTNHRYMDLTECPEHGRFLVRVRLSIQSDGRIRVSRLTYGADSDAAKAYLQREQHVQEAAERNHASAQRAKAQKRRTSRRRQHRKTIPADSAETPQS